MREIVDPVDGGHGGGGISVSRISLRRSDADAGRAEGDRVQRAPRRSRSAGHPAAHRRAAAAAARRRRRRRAARRRPCRLGAERLVGVVLASRGYPESSESGRPIRGIEDAEAIPGVAVYHAGTARCATVSWSPPAAACSPSSAAAATSPRRSRAPTPASLQISFDGMQYRRDIGRKRSEI